MDFFYVSGGHFELCDETRGKICGSIMMTTASMKYRSTFSTFKLQVVRSRPQERLVQSLKQGMGIWMLPNPGKLRKRYHLWKWTEHFWHLNTWVSEKMTTRSLECCRIQLSLGNVIIYESERNNSGILMATRSPLCAGICRWCIFKTEWLGVKWLFF
jgi:hypothetical protein